MSSLSPQLVPISLDLQETGTLQIPRGDAVTE